MFYIKCTNHKTKLPNKTYANCTVYDKKWWLEKLSNYYDDIKEIKISDLTSVCFIMKGENIMNYDINIREEVFGGTLMDVKTGNVVLFAKYSGSDVKVDNETFKILSVKDVLGIIE